MDEGSKSGLFLIKYQNVSEIVSTDQIYAPLEVLFTVALTMLMLCSLQNGV